MFRYAIALTLTTLALQPAQAQSSPPAATPATPLDLRIEQLPEMLAGELKYEDYFAPSFLSVVPSTQLKSLSEQFVAQHGKPLKILRVERQGPTGATIKIEYEKAIATADISVEAAAPNKVVGLLIKGFELKGDSPQKIDADFAKLAGTSGYLVEKIGADGQHQQIAGRNVRQQFAIASTFKLYVMAELAAQVKSGKLSWSDVVPLTENSYSSSATQGWPRTTPVTLQTLATWMISVSDNAATDTLIRVLDREAIEERLAMIGHGDPDKALPMLTTVEAFALKSNSALRAQFQKADEAGQRALLRDKAGDLGYEDINLVELGSGPVAIDSIEWFGAPTDVTALLDHIRQSGGQTALDVMAVNKGVAPATASKWQYLGYKGGSEPGVISMSFLAQSKAGEWYAITGSWNNPAKEVDNAAFAALMARLLDSVAG